MPNLYRARGWIEFDEDYSYLREIISSFYEDEDVKIYLNGWKLDNYEYNNCSYIFYGLQTKYRGIEILIEVLTKLIEEIPEFLSEFSVFDEYDGGTIKIILDNGKIETRCDCESVKMQDLINKLYNNK